MTPYDDELPRLGQPPKPLMPPANYVETAPPAPAQPQEATPAASDVNARPRYQPPAQPAAEQNTSGFQDVPTVLGAGSGILGQAAAGLFDYMTAGKTRETQKKYLGTGFGEAMGDVSEHYRAQYSPETQRQQQAANSGDGFWDTVGRYVENPRAIAVGLGESVPSMVTAAPVLRGLGTLGGTTYSAGYGAGISGADAQQRVLEMPDEQLAQSPEYQRLLAGGTDPNQAREILAQQAMDVAAPISGAISGVAGRLAAPFETSVARGQLGQLGAKQFATNLAKETVEEGVQEGGEQFASNVGVGEVDPNQRALENVSQAAAAGAVTGLASGGALQTPQLIADQINKKRANGEPLTEQEQRLLEAPEVKELLALPPGSGGTQPYALPDGSSMDMTPDEFDEWAKEAVETAGVPGSDQVAAIERLRSEMLQPTQASSEANPAEASKAGADSIPQTDYEKALAEIRTNRGLSTATAPGVNADNTTADTAPAAESGDTVPESETANDGLSENSPVSNVSNQSESLRQQLQQQQDKVSAAESELEAAKAAGVPKGIRSRLLAKVNLASKEWEKTRDQLESLGETVSYDDKPGQPKGKPGVDVPVFAEPPTQRQTQADEQPAIEPKGKRVKVTTPKGDEEFEAGYDIIEASDLITSHNMAGDSNPGYPQDLQPRDRSQATSSAQIRTIANRLDPERVGENRTTADGAPIVGNADNVVEQGNARGEGLRQAYFSGKGESYKQWLSGNAERFGIDAGQIAGMNQPVLVRRRLDSRSMADRADFARRSGLSPTSGTNATEDAVSDAKTITPEMLERLSPSDSGDMLAATNNNFMQQFAQAVTSGDIARFQEDNQWSRQAGERARAAVFHAAYGNRKLTSQLATAADPEFRNIQTAMLRVAPQFARMRAKDETLADGRLDLITPLAAAVETVSKSRRDDVPVKSLVNQEDMFADFDPAQAALATFIDENIRSAPTLTGVFRDLATMIETELNNADSVGLFGDDNHALSLDDFIQAAFKQREQFYETGTAELNFGQVAEPGSDYRAGRTDSEENQGADTVQSAESDGEASRDLSVFGFRPESERSVTPTTELQQSSLFASDEMPSIEDVQRVVKKAKRVRRRKNQNPSQVDLFADNVGQSSESAPVQKSSDPGRSADSENQRVRRRKNQDSGQVDLLSNPPSPQPQPKVEKGGTSPDDELSDRASSESAEAPKQDQSATDAAPPRNTPAESDQDTQRAQATPDRADVGETESSAQDSIDTAASKAATSPDNDLAKPSEAQLEAGVTPDAAKTVNLGAGELATTAELDEAVMNESGPLVSKESGVVTIANADRSVKIKSNSMGYTSLIPDVGRPVMIAPDDPELENRKNKFIKDYLTVLPELLSRQKEMTKMVESALRSAGSTHPFTLKIRPRDIVGAQGNVSYSETKSKPHVITISDALVDRALIETVAHESSHIITMDHFDSVDAKTKDSVLSEYLGWVDAHVKKLSADQHKEVLYNMEKDMERYLQNDPESSLKNKFNDFISNAKRNAPGREKPISAKDLSSIYAGRAPAGLRDDILKSARPPLPSYVFSFDEWMADAGANYFTTTQSGHGVLQKFFSELAEKLRRLFASVTDASTPQAAFDFYHKITNKKLHDLDRPGAATPEDIEPDAAEDSQNLDTPKPVKLTAAEERRITQAGMQAVQGILLPNQTRNRGRYHKAASNRQDIREQAEAVERQRIIAEKANRPTPTEKKALDTLATGNQADLFSELIEHNISGERMTDLAGQALNQGEITQRVHNEFIEQVTPNAPNSTTDLEPDSITGQRDNEVDATVDVGRRDGARRDTGEGIEQDVSTESTGPGDTGVPDRTAATDREPSHIDVSDDSGRAQLQRSVTDSPDDSGSVTADDLGISTRPEGSESATERAGADADGLEQRIERQRRVERVPSKDGDLRNIRATLPVLHAEQQEDVHFVEQRLVINDKPGAMLTNGTGTGKTFSGLGAIKRFARKGKDNILIMAPNDKIATDWIKSAESLQLNIKQLKDTKDNGNSGIVVTTYANAGQNETLADRQWDMVVTDESHELMQGSKAEPTNALGTLRAITGHPRGAYQRAKMELRDERAALEAKIQQEMDRLLDGEMKGFSPDDEGVRYAAEEEFDTERSTLHNRIRQRADALTAQPRTTKVLMLSATPFAYEKTVDYAEGYLFDYPAVEQSGAYNSTDGRESFFVSNFGYRMRYNKLTAPDADVDSGIMQRQFNERLKADGALRGRKLEVDKDYSREFVLVKEAIGADIDSALEFLREAKTTDTNGTEISKYGALYDHIMNNSFDYLARMKLLEAIKAKEAVPHIKQHLKLGRKVVVFHNFNVGGATHPFQPVDIKVKHGDQESMSKASQVRNQAAMLARERPDIFNMDLSGLQSPIETLTAAFPGMLQFNGQISKGKRRENAEQFNVDGNGSDIILVQSAAGRAGISLHDTTGRHQRALIHLGLPVRPVESIQTEGRIYRVGQQSDAVIEYMQTGAAYERYAFAEAVAKRSSTAENLGMGNEARDLMTAFIDAFEMADSRPPNRQQGQGGKEKDRASAQSITEYDKAKTFYFGRQKIRAKRNQRAGKDYFSTPEPVGLKMVEWLGLKPNEAGLEPSAGHGAIARWFPENTANKFVEPSFELSSELSMTGRGKVLNHDFESLDIVNKFDGIAMNPPYHRGGSTAVKHLDKASNHLRDGGRIVAIIPQGPAADKAFDKWYESDSAKDMHLVGNIDMPSVLFERAGTAVRTRIVVLDRLGSTKDKTTGETRLNGELGLPVTRSIDADKIGDLFDAIEDMGVPDRPVLTADVEQEQANEKAANALEDKGIRITEDNGKWYVGGNTFPHKDKLGRRGLGGRWDGNNKAWVFKEDPSADVLRVIGGETESKPAETEQVASETTTTAETEAPKAGVPGDGFQLSLPKSARVPVQKPVQVDGGPPIAVPVPPKPKPPKSWDNFIKNMRMMGRAEIEIPGETLPATYSAQLRDDGRERYVIYKGFAGKNEFIGDENNWTLDQAIEFAIKDAESLLNPSPRTAVAAVNKDMEAYNELKQKLDEKYADRNMSLTSQDEKKLELARIRAEADINKWSPGAGVGYKIGLGKTGRYSSAQINRGFQIVSIDPDTRMATLRQVADTGLVDVENYTATTDVTINTRLTDVHIGHLVRDKKYDAPDKPQPETPIEVNKTGENGQKRSEISPIDDFAKANAGKQGGAFEFVREAGSKKAILVKDVFFGRQEWLPKSQIEYQEADNGLVYVAMPDWLAGEKSEKLLSITELTADGKLAQFERDIDEWIGDLNLRMERAKKDDNDDRVKETETALAEAEEIKQAVGNISDPKLLAALPGIHYRTLGRANAVKRVNKIKRVLLGDSASADMSADEAAKVLEANGLKLKATETKNGTPVWEVSGVTNPYRELLADAGGRWYGPKKAYSYYDGDPTIKIAQAIKAQEQGMIAEPGTAYEVAPQTETKAFKDWFGDSKVVDEDGKPLVVYHGTDGGDFTEFDIGLGGKNFGDTASKGGFFFAQNKNFAEHYGQRAIDAYISIKNPREINIKEEYQDEYEYLTKKGEFEGDFDEFVEQYLEDEVYGYYERGQLANDIYDAKNNGQDGVILDFGDLSEHPFGEYGKVVIAFDPTQIKSASDNSGAFDPNNPSIIAEPRRRKYGNHENQIDLFAPPDEAPVSILVPESEAKTVKPGRVRDPAPPVSEAANAAKDEFYSRVDQVPVTSFQSPIDVVNSPEDVAAAMRDLGMMSQENMVAVVTDKDGKILNVIRHTIGAQDGSMVFPGLLAGAVFDTPKAANVWFAHNHPSGTVMQSEPDVEITGRLHELMTDNGINVNGMVVVTPRKEASYQLTGNTQQITPTKAKGANKALPVTSGVITELSDKEPVISPTMARKALPKGRDGKPRAGVLLLNNLAVPVGFVDMSVADMSKLRRNDTRQGAARLLAGRFKSNANQALIVAPGDPEFVATGVRNVIRALNYGRDMSVVDVLAGENADISFRSEPDYGVSVDETGTYYSKQANQTLRNLAQAAKPKNSAGNVRRELYNKLGRSTVKRLEANGVLNIVDDAQSEGVPASIKNALNSYSQYTTQGMYDSGLKQTFLFARNIRPGKAAGVAMHEIAVHYGMKNMLGAKLYNEVLDSIGDRIADGEKKGTDDARFANAFYKVPLDTYRVHFNAVLDQGATREQADRFAKNVVKEEVLAYYIENNQRTDLVRRILAAIKRFLRQELGIRVNFSNDELTALATASLRRASRMKQQALPPIMMNNDDSVELQQAA